MPPKNKGQKLSLADFQKQYGGGLRSYSSGDTSLPSAPLGAAREDSYDSRGKRGGYNDPNAGRSDNADAWRRSGPARGGRDRDSGFGGGGRDRGDEREFGRSDNADQWRSKRSGPPARSSFGGRGGDRNGGDDREFGRADDADQWRRGTGGGSGGSYRPPGARGGDSASRFANRRSGGYGDRDRGGFGDRDRDSPFSNRRGGDERPAKLRFSSKASGGANSRFSNLRDDSPSLGSGSSRDSSPAPGGSSWKPKTRTVDPSAKVNPFGSARAPARTSANLRPKKSTSSLVSGGGIGDRIRQTNRAASNSRLPKRRVAPVKETKTKSQIKAEAEAKAKAEEKKRVEGALQRAFERETSVAEVLELEAGIEQLDLSEEKTRASLVGVLHKSLKEQTIALSDVVTQLKVVKADEQRVDLLSATLKATLEDDWGEEKLVRKANVGDLDILAALGASELDADALAAFLGEKGLACLTPAVDVASLVRGSVDAPPADILAILKENRKPGIHFEPEVTQVIAERILKGAFGGSVKESVTPFVALLKESTPVSSEDNQNVFLDSVLLHWFEAGFKKGGLLQALEELKDLGVCSAKTLCDWRNNMKGPISAKMKALGEVSEWLDKIDPAFEVYESSEDEGSDDDAEEELDTINFMGGRKYEVDYNPNYE